MFRTRLLLPLLLTLLTILFLPPASPIHAQVHPDDGRSDPQAAGSTDAIVFSNGDQLTGHLVKVLSGKVTFHSDILGDVTVPWDKIRSLRSARQYAVIEKEDRVTRKTANDRIAVGSIDVDAGEIHVKPIEGAAVRSFPTKNSDNVIDEPSFQKEVRGESKFLYGWKGEATVGATLVEGTDTSQTYTGAVNFVRAIPTLSWLPLGSRTSLDLSGTYGLLTQPQIVARGRLIQTASSAKTNILHGDTEYDRYVSPRLFALVNASADHNFGSGLQLQQTYGLGFGWSLIKNPKQSLDLKADLHYEQQQFYNGIVSGLGTPTENLIGADLTETWMRTFADGIKLNQGLTLTPTFNVVQAYSGAANASLTVPIYRKFSFTLSSTDNYLGDQPAGYKRNTFQLTAGITYVLK